MKLLESITRTCNARGLAKALLNECDNIEKSGKLDSVDNVSLAVRKTKEYIINSLKCELTKALSGKACATGGEFADNLVARFVGAKPVYDVYVEDAPLIAKVIDEVTSSVTGKWAPLSDRVDSVAKLYDIAEHAIVHSDIVPRSVLTGCYLNNSYVMSVAAGIVEGRALEALSDNSSKFNTVSEFVETVYRLSTTYGNKSGMMFIDNEHYACIGKDTELGKAIEYMSKKFAIDMLLADVQ